MLLSERGNFNLFRLNINNWIGVVVHRLLDTLIDVTSDLTSVPLALGPDPSLFDKDDKTDESVINSQIDSGYYEITEELREGEEPVQMMRRDVEWM